MRNNYDPIAGTYDSISRIVFGKSLVRAQRSLLKYIPPSSRILIVGGGTGWILEEITLLHPFGLYIDYVEISAKMNASAARRNFGENRVNFIHQAIEDYPAAHPYDVVVTPFLFDNFGPERAETVFQKLHSVLIPGGQWLFTDFHVEKNRKSIWQKALLQTMYLFFRTISEVEARQLPDMAQKFATTSYEIVSEGYYFGHFIRSVAYRKAIPAPFVFSQK